MKAFSKETASGGLERPPPQIARFAYGSLYWKKPPRKKNEVGRWRTPFPSSQSPVRLMTSMIRLSGSERFDEIGRGGGRAANQQRRNHEENRARRHNLDGKWQGDQNAESRLGE